MTLSQLRRIVSALLLLAGMVFVGRLTHAQIQLPQLPIWFPPVWTQARKAPQPLNTQPGQTPATVPKYAESTDASGRVATYQPGGATATAGNAFFTQLGSNKRTCFTCHQPQSGWALSPSAAQDIFNTTSGTDPLFAPVDGANCPDTAAAAQTLTQKRAASSQLLTKGNIRVFLPVPSNAEFKVRVIRDPYGCETSSKYGLPSGMLSMYRRIMNATNLTRNAQLGPPVSAQGAIMWDGREPTLESQFIDATLGHAQAASAPTSAQVSQGVAFETGLFTAQSFDNHAGSLSAAAGLGGPVNLSTVGVSNIPDPVIPLAFHQFDAWTLPLNNAGQASINRGQRIFTTRLFTLKGVAGFNDVAGNPFPLATCSTCHNNLNVGSDAVSGGRHLGIGDNSAADKSGNQTAATVLPPSTDQPLFSFDCPVRSIPFYSNPVTINGTVYDEYQTSDPGMGLISGKCADLGKFKVPRLNGLAARAPYFHGGNAASLNQLVDFYNTRFGIGLSAQDKQDLVNFLNSL